MLKKNKKLLIGAIVALLIVAAVTATAVFALSVDKANDILDAIVTGEKYLEENDLNKDNKVDVRDAILAVIQDKLADSKLTPQIIKKNQVISPSSVSVEIGDTGVKISLDYLAWPTVVMDERGYLYAAASLRRDHKDPFGATAFFVSKDGGATWSKPKIINDSPLDDRDVGLVYIGNGKMVATFFTEPADSYRDGGTSASEWGKCYTYQKNAKLSEWNTYTSQQLKELNGRFVMTSNDYGETWSDPIKVPFSNPHGPSLMNDGKTLIAPGLSGSQRRVFSIHTSNDYGKTWTKQTDVNLPEIPSGYCYYEPYIIQLSDGSFLAGIRCEKSGVAGSSYSIWTMKSKDGKEWTEAQKIPTVVGAPPHFLELSNGAILLTYSYRIDPNRGVRGCLSYDGGETWDTEEFVISNNTSKNNRDLGYPSTVELADGTLITVYYQAYANDYPASLLYTKWKLLPAD